MLHEAPPDARWFDDLLSDVEARFARPADAWTGLSALDALIGSWDPPFMVGVTGSPGCGRSSLLLSVAVHAAKVGKTVFVASDHLSDRALRRRLASQLCSVSVSRLRDGRLVEREWLALNRGRIRAGHLSIARRELRNVPLHFAGLAPGGLAVLDMPRLSRDLLGELARRRDSGGEGIGVLVDLGTRKKGLDLMDAVLHVNQSAAPTSGTLRPLTLEVARNRLGPTGSVEVLFRPDTLQYVDRVVPSIRNVDSDLSGPLAPETLVPARPAAPMLP